MNKLKVFTWIIVLFCLAVSVQGALTDGMIAYYGFNESAGSILKDLHANTYNGTITNGGGAMIGSNGIAGNGYLFEDGGGDYVTLPTWASYGITPNNNFSLSVCVNYTITGTTTQMVLRMFGGYYAGIIHDDVDAQRTSFELYDGNWDTAYNNSAVPTGTWLCYVAVRNGTQMKMYQNGALGDIIDTIGTVSAVASSNTISNSNDATDLHLGTIDEVGLWSRALNYAEVQQLYANYTAGQSYPFGLGGGVPGTNFTITAVNRDTGSSITTFNVTLINASGSYNFSTASGTIVTTIPSNATSLFNITIRASHYLDQVNNSYNVSSDLQGNLTPYLQVRVFDRYDNATLDAYNVTYLSVVYNPEADNVTYLPVRDVNVNLTINKTSYYTSDVLNHDATNHLNTTIYQAILNVRAIDVINNSYIYSFNASLPIITNTTLNGYILFYVKAGTYTLNASSDGYDNYTNSSVTITALDNITHVAHMHRLINFTLYNEVTNKPLNMSGVDSAELYVYCNDGVTLEYNISGGTLYDAINCSWSFIKYDLDFNGSTYYRTRIPHTSITSERLYAIDVDNNVAVEVTLLLNDLTGDYSNGTMIVRKYIEGTHDIIEQYFDVENSVTLYLIKHHLYTLAIRNNDNTERNLGFFIPDSAGEKTLTLPEIVFIPDVYLGDSVNYDWTNNATHIRLIYNDSGINTSNITFYVYNGTNTSHLIYSTSSTNVGFVSFTYLALANTSYLACFIANHSSLGLIEECQTYYNGESMGDWSGWNPASVTKITSWLIAILSLMIILFAKNHITAGLGVVCVLNWVASLWGWISYGNTIVHYTILSFMVFFTIISFIIHGGKK